MWNELLDQLLHPANRGKIIGVGLGLLFGIFAAIFGILKALFISVCVFVGYVIGKRIDEQGNFKDILDKVINRERY